MATFLEDPRLRQRWNQISHTTETVTENAAAGIWSFSHTYITPCLASVGSALDSCTTVCLGDREERARRARDRQRARGRAEYSFDFYDDWDEELFGEEPGGGTWGGWRGEDWDRLLAGTGKRRNVPGEVTEQPRGRKRGMSYGTRGVRKTATGEEDPTIIPSTTPIGFLGRLPFKLGGTLRYKPSAANLQEHPGALRMVHEGEREPLLGPEEEDLHSGDELRTQTRKRSGTSGSGNTSDSYRSRGDLFPSDGEGEEDAVPLGDDLGVMLDRVDDRLSNRTRSSKGKKVAESGITRSASRTTISSALSSLRGKRSFASNPQSPLIGSTPSLEDLRQEEERLEREEDQALEKKRQAAADLALRRGLSRENLQIASVAEAKTEMVRVEDVHTPESAVIEEVTADDDVESASEPTPTEPHPPGTPTPNKPPDGEFIPARLPCFR
ncbi:hypothetical protein DL766_001130 [Monosporascus sp. MC13-8B]|uniref:Uncharacterized protein n=1 Tax=Monosporascus cannonballus TaxID=155416 RepID=A0ABY0GYB0_9PEZI|nr:hypothetical protein DL762_009328 [Monosporascus cannonballus]RYO90552.1 hypothetical protein DL763_005317 [Monosporascus cannonballus]RYP38220.1 hypothetical protein DL766_001130 [Monosporascus sp. MC13-8B]